MHTMRQALTEGVLHSGAAKKLAGRLNWAVQYLFHRLGRAMIRPIYDQAYSRFVNALHCVCVQDPLGFAYSRNGSVGKELRVALTWWLWALGLDIMEERPWTSADEPLAHLFVDARGSPAHCAAVLFIDGRTLFTDGRPSQEHMEQFRKRADNQIMSLEILAIVVGLSTFTEELRGRKVILWSDNTGAESAARKGSAHSFDHCLLIHSIWFHALANRMALWIERVASASNISDLPSRECYGLLNEFDDVVWREPKVAHLHVEHAPRGASSV